MPRSSITHLQHYMFTGKHIMKIIGDEQVVIKQKEIKRAKQKKPKKEKESDFLLPIETDTLFWCFYILYCGLFKYETLGSDTFKEEKAMKIKLVEDIRNHKDLLKKNKWKKTIIENDLVSEKRISLNTFFCICAIKNINPMVVKGRLIYSQQNVEKTPFSLIMETDHGFMLSQHTEESRAKLINEYMVDYWVIDNINKPLAAISSYKVGTIKDICKKLQIPLLDENDKKYTKKQLYSMISSKI